VIPVQFLAPEGDSALGKVRKIASGCGMAVPKAAMHEDDLPTATKDEVRATGELSNMQSVPIAKTVEEFSDGEFRLGIFRLYATHSLASFCRIESVCHSEILARGRFCLGRVLHGVDLGAEA
jgi:hypothetical protein